MTAQEIVRIIKACKESNVSKIKMDGIELEFHDLTNYDRQSNNSINIGLKDNTVEHVDAIPEIEHLENQLSDKRHKEVYDEFVMANLMADDPIAFENRQRGILNGQE